MDSNLPSPNEETNEQKAQFRKPTNEAAHRKYRRRSPTPGMSDEDGSPKLDHSYRRNSKASDHEKRSDDRVDDRHSRRSDPYRHSSRGNRHDEHSRYGKHADEDDRRPAKSSYRTGRDSDLRDRQSEYDRSRDRNRDVDRYSRDRSDVAIKKYKEKESSSDRVGYDGRHGSRYDDRDRYSRDKDHRDDKREFKCSRETDNTKDVDASVREDFASKRPKLFSSENTEARKVDETTDSKLTTDQTAINPSDSVASADAAKVAAMKAAELVNKNLTGMGIMTADQKKKLLWGSKKSTTTEETSHRWDSAMFSDRERQEKFNKLMGVKGDVKTISKPVSSQDAEKLQVDLEKQYTAGLRRRDGRTVGLGL
ncbi:hypothetical protein RND81_12G012700 [Saponaria officinalis]|uniref:Small acidic protein-like domain-containing protein n=1 Tax=Saponaria officinalis TaxID=3572 RepID=A0AAW1H4D6_SAPOF